MEGENEQERDRHLYFIGLDAAMPVKLMSQLSRGGRVQMKSKKKEGEERGRCRKKWLEMSEKGRERGEEGGSGRG